MRIAAMHGATEAADEMIQKMTANVKFNLSSNVDKGLTFR